MQLPLPRRSLGVEQVGDATVVTFTEQTLVDDRAIRALADDLLGLVRNQRCRRLVVNLGRVRRLSTVMVGHFITLNKALRDSGGRLILCEINPQVSEVFHILRLPRVISMTASEREAVECD